MSGSFRAFGALNESQNICKNFDNDKASKIVKKYKLSYAIYIQLTKMATMDYIL